MPQDEDFEVARRNKEQAGWESRPGRKNNPSKGMPVGFRRGGGGGGTRPKGKKEVVTLKCPGCELHLPAEDLQAQATHLEQHHPEIIEQRLKNQ